MKKAILVVAVAVPLVLFAAGWQASAQDGDDNSMLPQDDDSPMWFPGARMQAMMEKLGITEEQVSKLQEARTAHMKEMIEIGAKLRVAQIELRDLMQAHGNDQAVLAKHNEINDIRTQMGELRLRHQLAQRAVFTAEQWEKAGKYIGMMQHRRGGKGGFGRHGGMHSRMGGRGGMGMHQRNFDGPRGRMFYQNR